MTMKSTRWCALALVALFGLSACGRSGPERIRLYVVKKKQVKNPTKAPTTKPDPKKEIYESPGRLKASSAKVYTFTVPRGLKRISKKRSESIVMRARLPVKDLAHFFKVRPEEYLVIDQPRGFKVLTKAHL